MKLINSSYEIVEPKSYSLEDVYKHIELCGRVCYKSEDKITPDSSTKFVDRMIKSGHMSTLEHGTVYLYREFDSNKLAEQDYHGWTQIYVDNPYSVISITYRTDGVYQVYVTTNYRVIVENRLEDDLQYIVDQPMDGHERRYTVRFVCDRGVSHEFVRHRHFSFSQESTRYCNYSRDKFDGVSFIIPEWYSESYRRLVKRDDLPDNFDKHLEIRKQVEIFEDHLKDCEDVYLELLSKGCKPQDARAVLPNALKTELIMTGFASDWEHFFSLRDNSKAHPDAYKLAHDLHNEFIKRNYVYGETNNKE